MPVSASTSASSVVRAFLRPAGSLEADWLDEFDPDQLDAQSLDLLPLLSDRFAARSSSARGTDHHLARLLGICKRGWAQNQIQLRELASIWTFLEQAGVRPLAICGPAALALVYQKERSVRTISSFHLMVPRQSALAAKWALEANGWRLQPDMPSPEGLMLDRFPGIWLRSASGSSLFLLWRLRSASPEMAADNEPAPSTVPAQLFGTAAARLASEELLLTCLLRDGLPEGDSVGWQTDAVALLRNEAVDWDRYRGVAQGQPNAMESLRVLQAGHQLSIPDDILKVAYPARSPGCAERLWTDYRQVSWATGEPHTLLGFGSYVLRRGLLLWPASPITGTTVILSAAGRSHAGEYARYRSLFFFLVLRDIRLRYQRTWRGVLWAMLQPLLPMLIFAAIFARVLRPEVQHGPYWLFVLVGLAPWNFFANAVNYASATFVGNFDLLNKVYFPRAILPAASVSALILDLLVSSTFVAALSWWQGYRPTAHWLALPAAITAAALVAGAIGLAAASFNVLHRDLKPLVGFLVQVGLYATPVLYPLAMLPFRWRWMAWLNPMTGVVAAFRFAFLGAPYDVRGGMISAAAFAIIAVVAIVAFRKLESDMAELL